jgi:hypothetical protein
MKRLLGTSAVFAAALLFGVSLTAHASKKSAPEVYSATDDSADEQPAEDDGQPVQLPSMHYKRPVARPAKTAVVKVSAPVAPAPLQAPMETAPLQNRITGPYFDAVPSDQAESIAKRLKVVEVLLRKYHRAYDYRSHTYHELLEILAELDRGTSSAPVAPAPNSASDEPIAPPPPPAALETGGQS